MDYIKIGSFLQALRKAKGLTQAEVAEYFEVTNKTVSKWECGESLPEIPLLKGLAEYYNVTVDEILSGGRAIKEEKKEIVKSNNEDYFINKSERKMRLWMIISYISLALAHFLIYIVGYSTGRCDVGFFVSFSMFFISVCLFVIGVYLTPKIDRDFTEEKLIRYWKHKMMFYISYWIPFVALFSLSLFFFIDPIRNFGENWRKCVVDLLQFFTISSISIGVAAVIDLIICYVIHKSFVKIVATIKRYPYEVVMFVFVLFFAIRLIFADFGIVYYSKVIDGTVQQTSSAYSIISFQLHPWWYYFAIFAFAISFVLLVISIVKKNSVALFEAICLCMELLTLIAGWEIAYNHFDHYELGSTDYYLIDFFVIGIVILILIIRLIYIIIKNHKLKKKAVS